MTADPQRWLWAVGALALWLALIAVLALTFWLYSQPELAIMLAEQLWEISQLLDAFGLHTCGFEMAAGEAGVLGRDPEVAGAAGFVRVIGAARDRQAAQPDAEIDRRVKIGVVEFLDHVGADDPDLRRAMGDEGRDVEGAYADHPHVIAGACKGERAAFGIVEFRIRLHPGARHHRQRFIKDAPLGDSEGQLSGIVVSAVDGHDWPRT